MPKFMVSEKDFWVFPALQHDYGNILAMIDSAAMTTEKYDFNF